MRRKKTTEISCRYCPRAFAYDAQRTGRGSGLNRARATRGVHEKAAHRARWLAARIAPTTPPGLARRNAAQRRELREPTRRASGPTTQQIATALTRALAARYGADLIGPGLTITYLATDDAVRAAICRYHDAVSAPTVVAQATADTVDAAVREAARCWLEGKLRGRRELTLLERLVGAREPAIAPVTESEKEVIE